MQSALLAGKNEGQIKPKMQIFCSMIFFNDNDCCHIVAQTTTTSRDFMHSEFLRKRSNIEDPISVVEFLFNNCGQKYFVSK